MLGLGGSYTLWCSCEATRIWPVFFTFKVRYLQQAKKKRKPLANRMRRVHRTSSRRSGYAFAHQEGYGELITSGKNMRLNVPQSSSSLARTMLSSTSWIENLRKKTAENFNSFSSDKSSKLWSLDHNFFFYFSCGHIFALHFSTPK